jgi:hypothetical protein
MPHARDRTPEIFIAYVFAFRRRAIGGRRRNDRSPLNARPAKASGAQFAAATLTRLLDIVNHFAQSDRE